MAYPVPSVQKKSYLCSTKFSTRHSETWSTTKWLYQPVVGIIQTWKSLSARPLKNYKSMLKMDWLLNCRKESSMKEVEWKGQRRQLSRGSWLSIQFLRIFKSLGNLPDGSSLRIQSTVSSIQDSLRLSTAKKEHEKNLNSKSNKIPRAVKIWLKKYGHENTHLLQPCNKNEHGAHLICNIHNKQRKDQAMPKDLVAWK